MHKIPKLLEIVQSMPVVEASSSTASVMELFNKDSDILALPIVSNGAFIGIVRKSLLYKSLSKAYALDIYSRRPISSLVDPNPVIMDSNWDINSALSSLLKTDPHLETDSIAVLSEGKCLGIIPVSSLMMSISDDQSRLLKILEDLTARIGGEVEKAAQIQQALLPSQSFSFPGIELASDLRTCTEVGGDFYDYFLVDENQLGLIIADVSGHGVQAGMVTTAAKASLHALVRLGISTPGLILSNMNEVILATTGQTLLMTCLIVIINTAERRIRYANTGHNYPYLFRKCSSAAEMLESAQCFPLGFETKRLFEEKTIAFNPGDTLVLYSDGVNECSNGVEDYGYERFEKSLAGLAGFPPRVWVKNILQSLADFSGSAGFEDDVSLTVACFRNEAESGLVDVNSFLLNSCHGEFA